MRLVLLGPPGAGKGTQAAIISARYNIPHLSTGDMLRSEIRAQTTLGRSIEQILSNGGLVNDEIMIDVVAARLSSPDTAAGFVLDGFPRTLGQALALERILAGQSLDAVIELTVNEDEIIRRIVSRSIASRAAGQPSRSDDNPETARRRLAAYFDETAPLSDYYAEKSLLARVDGLAPVDTVSGSIAASIEGLR
ncbi:adenylate kinase [Rhizobium lusitanum]|uniref:Adenylate kinase n=1 Tax=Rhizobium lusitanum TaxID=293958 RepID=A0A6L9UFT5_9HYPH|nr:adenylate kinase [Rhizobium lusitanum]NEI74855.1 adenylate kinase [Rhizobium lusitanum]